jgi:glycosyltransferase involved in cell wall biosynthesis
VISTPIPIVGVDVDAVVRVALEGVATGQRVWLELNRGGRVVGVCEVKAEDGGVSEAALRECIAGLAPVSSLPYEVINDSALPFFSVVVPTICRIPARLQKAVDYLVNLDYPHYEIIIVDNRPDPNRQPLPPFAGGERVRTYWEPLRGVSAARNFGIAQAAGEIIAFTDDDVSVDAQWLRELGTRFVLSPEVDAVSGLALPLELRTEPQLWFEEYFGGFNQSLDGELLSMDLLADDPLFPYATGRFGASCNMAIRLSTLKRIGYFDVRLGVGTPTHGGEDIDMSMKLVLAQGTFAFEPRAKVRHQHRDSDEAFFTQVFGYGTGLTAMLTKLVFHDPRHLFKMARRFPRGLRVLLKPRDKRSPSAYATYPRKTYAYHFLGMAYGPFAYLRSVARYRGER